MLGGYEDSSPDGDFSDVSLLDSDLKYAGEWAGDWVEGSGVRCIRTQV